MTARYLIRLDDACPTMDAERWGAVEGLLDELGIRPIVAVVPDNRHPDLVRGPPDPAFWERVRGWEAKGWTIALHGLHHVYHPVDRRRLIVPFHDRSEFAGLPLAAQAELIARGWSLFAAEGVRPTVWVAPGHAFDAATVQAIAQETPIRLISDGLSRGRFTAMGFTWLPQQLWRPARRAGGLWTICLHPNTMSDGDLARLRAELSQPFYRRRLAAVAELDLSPRARSLGDRLYPALFFARQRAVTALLPLYHFLRRRPARA